MYDRPFQWGSKRAPGPTSRALARLPIIEGLRADATACVEGLREAGIDVRW